VKKILFFFISFSIVILSQDIPDLIKSSKPSLVSIVKRVDTNHFVIIGSGFFINNNGTIATCYHVVKELEKVFVLKSEDLEKASFVGYIENQEGLPQLNLPVYKLEEIKLFILASIMKQDVKNDLAVLWTNLVNTSHLEFGSTDSLNEGDEVIFLGFPFGYNRATTHKGMVSYKGKIIISDDSSNAPIGALQIDGIINSGNSGGPLISPKQNKVVGVIKAKAGNVGAYLESIIKGKIKTRGIGLGQIDFGIFTREVASAIDRHIQMGIGFAIIVESLRQLVK